MSAGPRFNASSDDDAVAGARYPAEAAEPCDMEENTRSRILCDLSTWLPRETAAMKVMIKVGGESEVLDSGSTLINVIICKVCAY